MKWKYSNRTEESECQKFVDSRFTKRKPSCLEELQEGMRAQKHQMPWRLGWRIRLTMGEGCKVGFKARQNKCLGSLPPHTLVQSGYYYSLLMTWMGLPNKVQDTQLYLTFRVAGDMLILKKHSWFIWNSNFTRQSLFCFSLAKYGGSI